ncbi:hemin uptake protein HemP [Pseudoxanthomonas sp. F11]|jgi:hemin uptake protein HemP|uniref:Hemin uptake protein HemP n=1 Tax=Pseudoxanthomonas mexicana TaxID=128785 RepID=A0A7G9TGJ2_PSEMX|nr:MULTISPECIES: hemin uptake protein HemP [Pseudoxanthomonas]MBP6457838.1 hemin uptake protein HemP [Pseudoxanthomonas sp.]MCA0297507.1 hemin uptake protein HemP [Pseudomonadota bacterium]MCP1585097.1 hemin uptake protein HemP [Pseudoxanthomonas mexicana]MDZ4048140.1 hemin uptake protein HemP [Pseudoxanthomonas sp.]QLQ27063.1 MAG: hemin uptake protein HemP [Pseudoxanthomonas sp.]
MISNVTALPTSDSLALRERLSLSHARPQAEDTLDSTALLKGQREVLIRHGDRVYRLRHTSNDKLILTK